MTIKNAIFDLGNVLFRFDGKELIAHFDDGKYSEHLFPILFNNWHKRDRGELSDEEFLEVIQADLNEDERQIAKRLLDHWIDCLEYDRKVLDVIAKLRRAHIKVFAISNIPADFAHRFKSIEALKDIEDAIFSSTEHLMKPDQRIFERAITKFKINPQETLYIDDHEENVKAAMLCGFKGVVYKNNIDEIYGMIIGGR